MRRAQPGARSSRSLLAKLRYRLRREHGFPRESGSGRVHKFGVTAVFSDEPVQPPRRDDAAGPDGADARSLLHGFQLSITVAALV
ncbi:MAG: hypothetical protein U5L03_05165 [Burkholderiaceae bacterium]|nr:hypothetical protein [Burkholderiaceae bacterium]